MTTTLEGIDASEMTTPLIVVSSDSHAGPRAEDLRPYWSALCA
jgi:hypothetical protein